MRDERNATTRSLLRRLLLLSPFVASLWVPFYNRAEPALWGFPFFYWYLFACLFALPAVLWLAHRGGRR